MANQQKKQALNEMNNYFIHFRNRNIQKYLRPHYQFPDKKFKLICMGY